jgi:hypothetical protein
MAPYEETLFIVAVLAAGAFIAWLVARYLTERARERERRSRVVETQIERFAEAREFVEFARSDTGYAWLRADSGEVRVRRGLLLLLVAGLLFACLGGALLVNAARLAGATDPNVLGNRADAQWWGTVWLALGLGSMAASFVIARLGRAWGLVPPNDSRRRETPGE